MTPTPVVALVGNPRPQSRTAALARILGVELATRLPEGALVEIDLAVFGQAVLDRSDADVADAMKQVLAAGLLVVASPTYKATYSGLLKAFLDRFGTGELAAVPAVPLLLGGAPDHRLAVDVHFTPLLLELGASVPVRGLFVLESEVDAFPERARAWVAAHHAALLGPSRCAG